MILLRRSVVSIELMLLLPSVLFMVSLFTRSAFQPANAAEAIVSWYAGRMWTLWVLLLGLPLAALVIGAATVLRSWRDDHACRVAAGQVFGAVRAHMAMLLVAAATAVAGGVLMVVGLHIAAN